MTVERAATSAAATDRHTGGWGYLAALTPIIFGTTYLLISGIVAYALWFWGLQRLAASAVTFLTLLNPVAAALLGWIVLDQRLNAWQLFGAAIILISVVLGQPGIFERRFDKRRSGVRERRVERAPPRGH
jgi:probable blue pigment (indigoidine) exporter